MSLRIYIGSKIILLLNLIVYDCKRSSFIKNILRSSMIAIPCMKKAFAKVNRKKIGKRFHDYLKSKNEAIELET